MAEITGAMLPFGWNDEEENQSRHGDGISRPKPKARTKAFRVVVRTPGAPPMIWTTQAETVKHAQRYAEARWPGASVEVSRG